MFHFISYSCPYKDDHYLTTPLPVGPSGLQYPSHYKRFVVKMFTFVDQSSLESLQERVCTVLSTTSSFSSHFSYCPLPSLQQIFIHCTTSVCHPSPTEPCEPSCGSRTSEYCCMEDSRAAFKSNVFMHFSC